MGVQKRDSIESATKRFDKDLEDDIRDLDSAQLSSLVSSADSLDLGPFKGVLRYLLLRQGNWLQRYFAQLDRPEEELLEGRFLRDPSFLECMCSDLQNQSLDNPAVGLEASRLFQWADLEDLGWLLYYARDFGAVFQAISKYLRCSHFRVEEKNPPRELYFHRIQPQFPVMPHYIVGCFVGFFNGVGLPLDAVKGVTLPEWCCPVEPIDQEKLEAVYKAQMGLAPQYSGQEILVRFAEDVESIRLTTGDTEMVSFFERRIKNRDDSDCTVATDFLQSVKRALLSSLDNPSYGAQELSEELEMSKRKFERILTQEKVNFRTLKQKIQRNSAIELLEMGLSSKEVAFRVGFDNSAAFSRAFRRWTGSSPSQYQIGIKE